MDKLILNSILAVVLIAPAIAASDSNPRRALQKVLVWTVAGACLYAALVVFVYPRFAT